jgi:multiple antibiotic resistance protein
LEKLPVTILSATVLLFLVIDPFGNISFFISAVRGVPVQRRNRVILRELAIALAALVAFLFAGRRILQVLQISEPALTVAGGIILFLISVKMVFPTARGMSPEEVEGEPFVVPLAIPYVAGPSALSTVMFIMNQEPDRWREWLAAVVLAWALSSAIIFSSGLLGRFLGDRGLIAIERLMGMVLVTISVQMLLSGVADFRASL